MTSMPALTYKKVILDNKILKFTDTDTDILLAIGSHHKFGHV